MKVLHLSFHTGCINDLKYVLDSLNIENEYFTIKDYGELTYNITHTRAEELWNKYNDYFNKFDCIITSDTAPLSRIFLQNNWNKKLIIWICNRFDYAHRVYGEKFPDQEYYNLIYEATKKENMHIIGYAPFENYYCYKYRNIDIGNNIIYPCGGISKVYKSKERSDISDTIFVGMYHNDNTMLKLSDKLNELDIKNYNGRYDGPFDLKNYKAVVHFPYAWANLAFYEALFLGIVYFVPSLKFLLENINNNFWFQDKYALFEDIRTHQFIDWYNPRYKDCIIYFNSWEELKYKIENTNYKEHKEKLKQMSNIHINEMLSKWNQILS